MALLETWRKLAYETEMNQNQATQFWGNYFNLEKGIYEQLLSNPDEVVTGTVKELAEKYGWILESEDLSWNIPTM